MAIHTYISCLIAGLLGQAIHLFAVKLPGLKARATAANMPFSIKTALADDWLGIAASFFTILVALICLDELVKFKPAVVEYLKFAFVFIGYTGSSILLAVLSKADKTINTVVDVKTDIADNKIGQ